MRTRAMLGGDTRIGVARASRAIAALAALASTTCATVDEQEGERELSFGRSQQALTSEQARVLGFETPTADWSSNAGTLGTSSNASNGAAALTVVPGGWTEINSIPLSTLANVRDTLSYDVYLPQVPGWGETRAILVSPTLGQWWTELGRQELNQLPGGQYSTVSFPLSSSLVTALSGAYSDLTIKLVINAPVLSQPYRIDHLVMTNEGNPPLPAPAEAETFTVLIPSGVSVQGTFVSATDHVSILSQARAGLAGATPAIANFGPFTTYLQAEAHAEANILSAGPVQLDVKTRVGGSVTSEGTIGKQGVGTNDAPVIVGGEFPQTNVDSELISWSVEWPSPVGSDVQLNAAPTQTPVNTTLAPGAYGDFNVHSRNHVFLSSGTYFFDTFNTEPEAQLHLDTSSGAIIIYVKQNLPWGGGIGSKAPVFTDDGDEAQLLLAFLGTGDVFVQGSWQGTIVAPDALIKLERPSNPGISGTAPGHQGAFFGKGVEIAAGQHTVEHVPMAGGLPFVTPLVCVEAVGGGKLAAKFGYENLAGGVTVAVGPNNLLAPAPMEVLGQTVDFEAGRVEGAFRAIFPATGTLSWTVLGRTVVASGTSPNCPIPPAPEVSRNLLGDGAKGYSPKVGPLQPYFVAAPYSFFSRNFDDPSGAVPPLAALVPDLPAGVLAQQLPSSAPTRVKVYLVGRDEREFPSSSINCIYHAASASFGTEALTNFHELPVCQGVGNGTFGTISCPPISTELLVAEKEFPADLAATNANLRVDTQILFVDDFAWIAPLPWPTCPATSAFAHAADPAFNVNAVFELRSQVFFITTGDPEGLLFTFRIEVERQSAPPAENDARVCVEWNTDYVDEGLGEGVVGPHPASHAEYFLALTSPRLATPLVRGLHLDPATGLLIRSGPTGGPAFLDAEGCIPRIDLDPSLLVHKPGDAQEDIDFELRVRTVVGKDFGQKLFNIIRDPNAIARQDLQDGYLDSLSSLVLRISNEPDGGFDPSTWPTAPGGWVQPPSRIVLQNPTLDPLTNVAAMASRLAAADDIAIENGTYPMLVGAGCDYHEVAEDPPVECTTDDDCTGVDRVCDTNQRRCGCFNDGNCLQGRLCQNPDPGTGMGQCGAQACSTNADCTLLESACNTATGTCGCQSNADCLQGRVCDQIDPTTMFGVCGAPECENDSNCTALDRICDTTSGQCGCRTSGDCRQGRFCAEVDPATGFGQCTARFCTADTDCEGIDAVCNPNTNTCGCQSDTDCRRERTCEDVDSNTNYGRCGIPGLSSCGASADLWIGPAGIALNSKDCQAGDVCGPPGQLCLQADSSECPVGATCQCRWVDQSRWKYVIAHEAGHMIQARVVGDVQSNGYYWDCDVKGGCSGPRDPSGELFDPPNSDVMCGCGHVDAASRSHCLQSIERMGAAEAEGFAQFFASRVWNGTSDPDQCVFNYYKEMILDSCPDPTGIGCEPRNGKIKVLPPVSLSCSSADRWRNTRCGGLSGTNNLTLAEMGTERDWMQFLWNWNRRGPDNTFLPELFEVYRSICTPTACVNAGERVPGCLAPKCAMVIVPDSDTVAGEIEQPLFFTWLPPPPPPVAPTPLPTDPPPKLAEFIAFNNARDVYEDALALFLRARSYRDGVLTYYGSREAAAAQNLALRAQIQARRNHFTQMALDYGINEDTTP